MGDESKKISERQVLRKMNPFEPKLYEKIDSGRGNMPEIKKLLKKKSNTQGGYSDNPDDIVF